MANIISWIKDKKKENIIVPKTMTKAVYNDDGTVLSDTLEEVNSKLNKYKDIDIGAVTLNEHGYADITTLVEAQISDLQEVINVNIINWSGVTAPYNVSAQGYYLSGDVNASFSGVWLRVFYR